MMRTAMLDTSIDAFHSLPNSQIKTQADRIYDIVAAHCKRVGRDASLNEIKRLYRATHGKDIELSTTSARVNALVASGRLERLESTRPCAITKKSIHPVRLPMKQSELFN